MLTGVVICICVVVLCAVYLVWEINRALVIEDTETDGEGSILGDRAEIICARADYHRNKYIEARRAADRHWRNLEAYAEDLCDLHNVNPDQNEWFELQSVVLDGTSYEAALERCMYHLAKRNGALRMDGDDMLTEDPFVRRMLEADGEGFGDQPHTK